MNTNVSGILPYTPLPTEYHHPILAGFQQRFLPQAIREEHEFTAKNRDGRLKVNWAAFTDPQHHDLDTAAVTVFYDPEENFADQVIIEQLATTGAPLTLIGRRTKIQPFGISRNGKTEGIPLGSNYTYSEIGQFFEHYQADVNPERISAVKNGTAVFEAFTQLNPYQLRFFALEITRGLLAETFGQAVAQLRNRIGGQEGEQVIEEYAVRLLGAIILAHKSRLGIACGRPDASFDLVYQTAAQYFPAYFKRDFDSRYVSMLGEAYSILQRATYSSFTPEMLSELYLRAYPDREKRKKEGRYDTPLYLTRLILKNLPIETLRPENRLLLDMTCGWGSFLVAGYERMSQMNDMENRVLSNHIIGNDKDTFTAKLASVALLTTSLNDDWQVTNQDALQPNLFGRKPTIIVGNPPFKGDRKTGKQATEIDTETRKSKRLQESDAFLAQAIRLLEPGGYLSMLMPKSFSVGEASPSIRKLLLESCDVLDIWDLPDDIFRGQASVRPMVIFAQKRSDVGKLVNYPVRVRSTQGKLLEDSGMFTASNIAPDQAKWGETSKKAKGLSASVTHLISYTTILGQLQWDRINQQCQSVGKFAEIIAGPIVGTKRKWLDYPSPKRVPWLSGVKNTLPRPFYIGYGSEAILYPNELERPRKDKEHLLRSPKVLLVSDPGPSWGQRAKVAIERKGYYVSDSFWVFAPKSNTHSLEVLAAILSWDVSNAWIVEHLRYPKIQRRTAESIPVPHLTADECEKIEEAIHEIEAAAQQNAPAPHAQQVLDSIFTKAYRLDEPTFQRLRMVREWDQRSKDIHRPTPENPRNLLSVHGMVEAVNPEEQTISLWFDGIQGDFMLPIVDEMPGWMLRPGAAFSADVSYDALRDGDWEKLRWWNIRPKEYTYLEEDELIAEISAELSREA